MENVRKLEATVASWYKSAPRLPKEVSGWIARNAWWLVTIGVVIGIMGVLAAVSLTFFGAALLAGFGGVVGAALGGFAVIVVTIALGVAVVQLVLSTMAIQPLKDMRKKGWTLLFLVALIDVAALAVTLLFTFDLFGTLWSLLWVAVGAYFLFEVRQYFGEAAAEKKKVEAKTVAKETSK